MIARPHLGGTGELEAAFLDLMDAPLDDRDTSLARIRRSDPTMADGLERMLAADADLGGATARLDPCTSSDGNGERGHADVPDAGPRYVVGERIGAGGMGVVHLARQVQAPARPVAIKFLGVAAGEAGARGAQSVARFHREAVALGRLDHPGVAGAIDAGTAPDGRPFIVMEFVDGPRIDHWCDARRASFDVRLDQFQAVCAAISHAHQRGIVHRDLKGSNVLVGRDDRVRIIDFGIAGLVESEGAPAAGPRLTRADGWAGTPSNLPPEQIAGGARAVDTRSDVYALGLLLYELVAGVPPWDADRLAAAPPAELCRIILDESPARPSDRVRRLDPPRRSAVAAERSTTPAGHQRKLRGPLDRIIQRALEKDPERRYPTVDALRADIDRFRQHRAVEASAPSPLYLLRTFLRRHRAAALVAAIASGLLIGATVHSGLSARRAIESERRATRAAGELAMAEAGALARAREAVAARNFLFSALEAATPSGINADEVPVIELLDRMGEDLNAGLLDGSADVATQVHRFLADTFERLGDPRRAVPHLLAVEASILATGGEPDGHDQVRLASQLSESGELAAAAERYASVRQRAEPGSELDLKGTSGLANVRMRQGRFEESLVLQRSAFELADQRYSPDDPRRGYVQFNHGGLLAAMGRTAEAEAWYRGALEHLDQRGSHASRTRCRAELGWRVLAPLGRRAEAVAELERAVAEARRDLGPGYPETRRTVVHLMWQLIRGGHPIAAADLAKESMDDAQEHAPHDRRYLAINAGWAAWTARGVGRHEDAQLAIEVALEALAAHMAAEPDDDIDSTAWRIHCVAAAIAVDADSHLVAARHLRLAQSFAADREWSSPRHGADHAWLHARMLTATGHLDRADAILEGAREELRLHDAHAWRLGQLDLESARVAELAGDGERAGRLAAAAAQRIGRAFGEDRLEVQLAMEIAGRHPEAAVRP